MEAQLKRGLLDACVLSVLSRGDSYGYKIVQDAMSAVQITESTLYPILRRLEAQGCLETYSVEHNGRLRKYYRITPTGFSKLEQFKDEWAEIKQMVDYIMEPGSIPADEGE